MDTIGLAAVFEDSNFQAGLARYTTGLSRAESATSRTAGAMTAFGHTISTAIGTAVGYLAAQAIPALERAILSPIHSLQAWGGQLDTLRDEFGMSGAEASNWAVAMGTYMGSVDEGASGLAAFVRNLNNMQDGLKTAGTQFSTTMRDLSTAHADAMNKIAQDWARAQAEAGDSIASIWGDLAERRVEIESNLAEQVQSIQENLADSIASIQDSLNERLADFARQRAEIDKDTTKSLARLEDDTRDRLRNSRSAKERRQIRKDAAQRKKDLLEQAAERKAEIDRQEAEAKKQAAKQMALAEKVAAKQIEAAEKAAAKQIAAAEKASEKQIAAIEKALAKQQQAMQEAAAQEEKQFKKQQQAASAALGKAGESDPIAKALKQLGVNAFDATGKVRPFAELMPEIMDAFKALPAGINASAISMQLFGKGGSKFLDFLRQGREGLIKSREEAEAWGLILSNEDADAIEELGFELNRLKLQFTGIALTIGKAVLPYVSQFIGTLREGLAGAMPDIQNFVKRLSDAFKVGGLAGFGDELGKVFSEIAAKFSAWAGSSNVQSAIAAATKVLGDAIMTGIALILSAAEKVALVMNALFDSLLKWVKSDDGKRAIRELTVNMATAIIDGLTSLLGDSESGDKSIGALLTNLIQSVYHAVRDFIEVGITVATSVLDGIVKYLIGNEAGTRFMNALTNALTTIVMAICAPGAMVFNLGAQIANALYTGFTQGWDKVFNAWIKTLPAIIQNAIPKAPAPAPTGGTGGGWGVGSRDVMPSFDLGGWMNRTGPALLRAGEYVLNPMQARLMAPVLASPNYSRTTYNFSHTWNGGAGTMDRREIERIVETATYRSIRQVVGAG